MKDQVVMSPNNAVLAVAVPLYRIFHEESLDKIEGYSVLLTNIKPTAYIVDCGDFGNQMMNAEWVEKNLIFLGEL